MISFFIPVGSYNAQILALRRDLSGMASEVEDFKVPLTQAVQKVIIPSIETNFRRGGRPKWQELAESTVIRRGSSGPILIRDGLLRSQATSMSAWNISSSQARMNIQGYGQFHQTGTRKMPERMFALIQPQDEEAIEQIFDLWVQDVVISRGRWPA